MAAGPDGMPYSGWEVFRIISMGHPPPCVWSDHLMVIALTGNEDGDSRVVHTARRRAPVL
eukprot:7874056-Pyramimonas_sp.AAC.1